MFQATEEQARLLADRFIGRQTDYALQTASGRYRRVGLPVSLEVVQEHLRGSCTMGTYVIDEQGQCFFAVFDADQVNGLDILLGVKRQLSGDGIRSYLETSRRGGHLWVFFSTPLPAWAVRQWLLPYCPTGVEFYPKQDTAEGVGSLIRVPLGIHRLTGGRYTFVVSRQGRLVPVASSVAEMLRCLETIERVTVPESVFRQVTIAEQQARHATHTSSTIPSPIRHVSKSPTIAEWCAQYDPFAFIGRYVSLDSRGMGHCPFPGHHAQGKDHHPSFQVFQPKVPGGTCWRCYAGEVSGNLFNFLQMYHGLEAGELWAQLQGNSQKGRVN